MLNWRQPRIFISYRRDDSAVHARALYEDLVESFGESRVFFDVEEIRLGDAFRVILEKQLASTTVVVAVIGPSWLTLAGPDGRPRIHQDGDLVRHEIATTLRSGKRLIPVLVDGAAVPKADSLPDDLKGLASLNFLQLTDREIGKGNSELVDALRGTPAKDVVTQAERQRRARFTALGLTLALLCAAWLSLFDLFLSLDTKSASLTLWLADMLAPEPLARDLQLVVIDPETETALGKSFTANPAARTDHARLIERLAEAGVRMIAFDVYLVRPSRADDAVLVRAIERAQALGTSIVFGARDRDPDGQPAMVPALRSVVNTWAMLCIGQRLGYANAVPLVSRRVPGNAETADVVPRRLAVGLALAAASPGRIRTTTVLEDARKVVVFSDPDGAAQDYAYTELQVVDQAQTWCPIVAPGDQVATAIYRMSPLEALRDPANRLAYERVFELDAAVLRRRFEGKTVLVGVQMPNSDLFPVFRGWTAQMRHGLELHANATSALLRNSVVEPLGWVGQFVAMLAAALIGSAVGLWSAVREVAWLRRALVVVAGLSWMAAAAWLCVASGSLVNISYVLVALAAGYWSARRSGLR